MKTLTKYGKSRMRLPKSIEISFDELVNGDYIDKEDLMDEDYVSDAVSDILSDEFGFCHYGFSLDKIDSTNKTITVSHIDWDIS